MPTLSRKPYDYRANKCRPRSACPVQDQHSTALLSTQVQRNEQSVAPIMRMCEVCSTHPLWVSEWQRAQTICGARDPASAAAAASRGAAPRGLRRGCRSSSSSQPSTMASKSANAASGSMPAAGSCAAPAASGPAISNSLINMATPKCTGLLSDQQSHTWKSVTYPLVTLDVSTMLLCLAVRPAYTRGFEQSHRLAARQLRSTPPRCGLRGVGLCALRAVLSWWRLVWRRQRRLRCKA